MKNKRISLLICSLLLTSTLVTTVSCVGTSSSSASGVNSSTPESSRPISSDTGEDKPSSSTSTSKPDLPDSEPDGVEERVIQTAYGNTKTIKQVENASTDTLIKLIRGREVLSSSKNELNYSGSLNVNDVIEVTSDYQYLVIDLFDGLGEQLLYSPSGNFVFQIPSTTIQKTYPTGVFSGNNFHFEARVASDKEVTSKTVRNLASNPYDFMYILTHMQIVLQEIMRNFLQEMQLTILSIQMDMVIIRINLGDMIKKVMLNLSFILGAMFC